MADRLPTTSDAGRLERLERRLLRQAGAAIGDHQLIVEGDRVLIAVSGGKDSFALLHALLALKQRAPVRFELAAANLDPGHPGYRPDVVERYVRSRGLDIFMLQAPIRELIAEKLAPGEPACPLCSRMRRGTLYSLCRREGFNKLALGHHLDDALETLLMNLFYSGALRAMPARFDRPGGPVVIRPLIYLLEREVADFAAAAGFPIIPRASEGCADPGRRRQTIKRILAELEQTHPRLKHNARRALANVDPTFLWDKRLKRDED